MFFPMLRRKAKWVFLALAIVFGGGYVVFGVGSGVQGTSLGDVFQDVFQGRAASAGAPSVDEAREKVAENPEDAEATLELATALQLEGNTREAIVVLEQYRELRPRDLNALQQLATLYSINAARARDRAVAAQSEAQEQLLAQSIKPAADSPFGQAIAAGPITQAISQEASLRASTAISSMREAYRREATIYRELSLLQPDEAVVFLQLGQASQFAGDTEGAIAAYERFLELAPDDPQTPIIEQQLEQLRSEQEGNVDTDGQESG